MTDRPNYSRLFLFTACLFQVAFLVGKLLGKFDMPWWAVFMPTLLPVGLLIIIIIVAVIFGIFGRDKKGNDHDS